ncbi:MAG: BrnT family toxin [Acidobacteriota bacterium]
MDLSRIVGFEWDAGNARKNEKHGVMQAEIEQVFFREPLILAPDPGHSAAESRYHALGRTDDERWLQVTFTLRDRDTLIRPISALPMHRKERRVYAAAFKANP